MPRKVKRPIDNLVRESYDWWNKSYVFIKKTKIKTLYSIFIIAFFAGAAITIVWSVYSGVHQSSSAALYCPKPYHVLTADNRCVWSCAAGTTPDSASNECVCKEGFIETSQDQFGRRVCGDMRYVPYRLKSGRLYPGASSYNGAFPNYNKGYSYIHFMPLSKNPTYSSGIFQSSKGGPYFTGSNDNGNNEPLKLAWMNSGYASYGEGELTITGDASITVDFDGNPITIYLPINQPWKRTNFLGYTDLPDGTRQYNYDATYLYVASDGSTYWDEKLTQVARSAPVKTKCYDTDAGKNYYMIGTVSGYKYGATSTKISLKDKCNDVKNIKEYSCKLYQGGNRYIEETNIPCPYGCSNGSCILRDYSNLTCSDSDTGIDYLSKGTVVFGQHSSIDSCNGSQIKENFCQNENGLLGAYSSVTDGIADGSANITLEIRGKMDDSPILMGNSRRFMTIMYSKLEGSTSWSDLDNDDPNYFDPANYVIVMARRNTNWIGTLPESTFNMKVDGKTITVYLPSITYTDYNGFGYVSFYIAKDGSTYYAKKDHLSAPSNYGVDEWLGSVDLSPTESFNPKHLARASMKIGKVIFDCPNGCVDGACVAFSITPTCIDSDEIDSLYTAGNVSGINSDGNRYLINDECSGSGTQVNEGWCYPSWDGVGMVNGTMVYGCPNGCQDGACIEPPSNSDCVDSDGGINYSVQGRSDGVVNGDQINAGEWCGLVAGEGVGVVSSCSGSNCILSESYCYDYQTIKEDRIPCPNGCQDGACIQ